MARSFDAHDDLISACDKRGTLMPIKEAVLAMGRSFLKPHSHNVEQWRRLRGLEQISGLLMRLYEEATRSGDCGLAIAVLDILDSLIEAGLFQSGLMLFLLTQSD